MLSADEIGLIRTDAAYATCDLACLVQRKTVTPDGMGGFSESWSTVATTTAGMSQPSVGQLQNYDYLIGSLSTWLVRLPYGVDVRVQDHLVIEGETLVVQVYLHPTSYSSLTTVLASEVK
jgi:hypothetical protein